MNRKQWISLIVAIAGVCLLFYTLHGMQEANEAKNWVDKTEDFFTGSTWNPIIEFFGGEAREEASKYDAPLLAMLIIAIIMIIGGLIAIFRFRKK